MKESTKLLIKDTALALVIGAILVIIIKNNCSVNPHTPKQVHLVMCQLSCMDNKEQSAKMREMNCEFKKGICYWQKGCDSFNPLGDLLSSAVRVGVRPHCFYYKRN